jgi:hypothetical protein
VTVDSVRDCSYLIIWQFQIKTGLRAQFEQIYGADGAWARLFRDSQDYLGTTLVRDRDRAGCYLTIDHWTSRQALLQFKQEHPIEYAALDRRCESLTEREALIGEFEEVPLKRVDSSES